MQRIIVNRASPTNQHHIDNTLHWAANAFALFCLHLLLLLLLLLPFHSILRFSEKPTWHCMKSAKNIYSSHEWRNKNQHALHTGTLNTMCNVIQNVLEEREKTAKKKREHTHINMSDGVNGFKAKDCSHFRLQYKYFGVVFREGWRSKCSGVAWFTAHAHTQRNGILLFHIFRWIHFMWFIAVVHRFYQTATPRFVANLLIESNKNSWFIVATLK